MKITIDSKIVDKSKLDYPSLLAILLVRTGVDISELFNNMVRKEILVKGLFNSFTVTQKWDDEATNILLSSDDVIPTDAEIEKLALKLMEIVPQTKMPNTAYYYKGNKREITLKLKKFFKLYGNYPFDDIIKATQRYVNSFNGDYKYMKLLKYFIMKDEKRVNGDGVGYVEETSALATELENINSTDIQDSNWLNELK